MNPSEEYFLDNTPGAGHIEIGDNGHFTEIGDVITPWDAFMSEETRVGMNTEIGGNVEIGAAVRQVIKTARENRTPPPPMRAVPIEAPSVFDEGDWCCTDVTIGAAEAYGADQFPILSALLLKAGAGMEPRIVRVDTTASYQDFRADSSEEMVQLRERVAELQDRLAMREADPRAYEIVEEIDELTLLGEVVKAVEAEKDIDVRLPPHFGPPIRWAQMVGKDRPRLGGTWAAWLEGDSVCASIVLADPITGQLKICTAIEPVRKCFEEIVRHASLSGVPGGAVVGALPEIGTCLGWASSMKELAAAAGPILKRPETPRPRPFLVRIEPAKSPALCALAALALKCRWGDKAACDEWRRLSALAPAPLAQTMREALDVLQQVRA